MSSPEGIGRPIALVILDGWGDAPGGPGNAIATAGLETFARLREVGATCLLDASGSAVGLPAGVMGNSEVGHLTLGSGRILDQDLVRINRSVESGEIGENPAYRSLLRDVLDSSGTLHHLGLCSEAGVHSHLAHLRALVLAAERAGVERQVVHAFTDGRDTAPTAAARIVPELEAFLSSVRGARIATIMGRYFAMDRDRRWDRVERACRAIVEGEGEPVPSATEAIRRSHEAGTTDEFVAPHVVGEPAPLSDGDGACFYNYRADRARELTAALTQRAFDAVAVPQRRLAGFACMTEYDPDFGLPVLFPRSQPSDVLGDVISRAGWPQLRLAETEKYAHVTYFLNGGREEPFEREERILVPSPSVATYDLEPAMSAVAVTDAAVEWLGRGGARVLILNYANADMVGHTGVLDATVEACRVVDRCLGRIVGAVREAGGLLLVTADHGNAERLLDEQGEPVTAHTTARVPLIVLDARPGAAPLVLRAGGGLRDVAPTLLHLAGLPTPEAMTGRSLVEARRP